MTIPSEAPWAVVPAAVWDGGRLLHDHVVVIVGERIAQVCPVSQLPAGLEVTRLEKCTLLPGLIDCHVHLADWMLPGFLAAGVTTVRDTGNDLDWILERRARTKSVPSAGPTILCCGPVLDGEKVNWPLISRGHSNPEQLGPSIEELSVAGVDAVKLYVNLNEEQIRAAVHHAHLHGLPLLAHLGEVDAVTATAAGVKEVEHLSGIVHHVQGWHQLADLTSALPSLAGREMVMCPTLVVWDRLSRVNDPVFANDQRSQWVHSAIRRAWQVFPHRTGLVSERLDRQGSVVAMKQALGLLLQAGCTVIAGSDTPWPNLIPGFSLHDELALLVDAGLTASQALISATSAAARVLGIEGQAGWIRPGFPADLLAVAGDPTLDITALSDVRTVIRRGVTISQEELQATAQQAFCNHPGDPISRMILEYASCPPATGSPT